jgi:hypothetical protein
VPLETTVILAVITTALSVVVAHKTEIEDINFFFRNFATPLLYRSGVLYCRMKVYGGVE